MKRMVIATLWPLSLVVVGVFAHAQVEPQPITPTVLSGSDLGFRVTGHRNGRPVGNLVVRAKNGDWVLVEFGGSGLK